MPGAFYIFSFNKETWRRFIVEKNTNELVMKGILSKGYGNVPKLLTTDIRLSAEAKGLYAYLASYAGAGKTSFPAVSTIIYHMRISKDRFYDHFSLLLYYGYITKTYRRNEAGIFNSVIYSFEDRISDYEVGQPYKRGVEKKIKKELEKRDKEQEISPCPGNKDTVEPSPYNPDTVKPDKANKDTNKNNINKNNINKNNIEEKEGNPSVFPSLDTKNIKTDRTTDIENLFSQTDIENLNEHPDTINALKQVLKKMVLTDGPFRVGETTYYGKEHMEEILNQLTRDHLEHALKKFKEASRTKEIKNASNYMFSTIFNSIESMEWSFAQEYVQSILDEKSLKDM